MLSFSYIVIPLGLYALVLYDIILILHYNTLYYTLLYHVTLFYYADLDPDEADTKPWENLDKLQAREATYSIVFCFIILHYCTVLYHIISYHIISYHTIPFHTIPYYITLHYITLHYIIIHYIILYYIILYYIILYYTHPSGGREGLEIEETGDLEGGAEGGFVAFRLDCGEASDMCVCLYIYIYIHFMASESWSYFVP